jgi:hypothetical protein
MNGHQRRQMRRFLDKEALPRIEKGESAFDVASDLRVSVITLSKHLRKRGYIQEPKQEAGCFPFRWVWVKKGTDRR